MICHLILIKHFAEKMILHKKDLPNFGENLRSNLVLAAKILYSIGTKFLSKMYENWRVGPTSIPVDISCQLPFQCLASYFLINFPVTFQLWKSAAHKGAIPCQKSKNKGQCQKLTFLWWNMKEIKVMRWFSLFLTQILVLGPI